MRKSKLKKQLRKQKFIGFIGLLLGIAAAIFLKEGISVAAIVTPLCLYMMFTKNVISTDGCFYTNEK